MRVKLQELETPPIWSYTISPSESVTIHLCCNYLVIEIWSNPANGGSEAIMTPVSDPKKILLVDANAEMLNLMYTLLSRCGHTVQIATTGHEAIRQACELRPDVVFSSLSFADCTGYELAARLRATPESANAFIVALSGYSPLYSYDEHKAAGFDHRLMKPVNIDEIVETVAFFTKNSSPAHPEAGA